MHILIRVYLYLQDLQCTGFGVYATNCHCTVMSPHRFSSAVVSANDQNESAISLLFARS